MDCYEDSKASKLQRVERTVIVRRERRDLGDALPLVGELDGIGLCLACFLRPRSLLGSPI